MKGTVRETSEWLEADGLGGFSSGTTLLVRTRRYHALLLASRKPPTDRMVLVNGLEIAAVTASGEYSLSSQRYAPDVIHPDGRSRIESFEQSPFPRWTFRLEDGVRIEQEIFVPHQLPCAVVTFRLVGGATQAHLRVRPLLSCRDHHALHHENPDFRFETRHEEGFVFWQPYSSVPGIRVKFNGCYTHQPLWYRGFLYSEERDRGFECTEDLASPGEFEFDLALGEAQMMFCADRLPYAVPDLDRPCQCDIDELRRREIARRTGLGGELEHAADQYLVRRAEGHSIIAGYPWFTDWGRDTFIAMRGLVLATGRLDVARSILLQWAESVTDGMLPNRFTDDGSKAEYNSVDAALWFVVATHEYLEAAAKSGSSRNADRVRLLAAIESILDRYRNGALHGIHADTDGLLAAGEPGVQLTWMDARVGDQVITPRIGKPVEVQALWINALWIISRHVPRFREDFERALESFSKRFWNEESSGLFDVVDDGHQQGRDDASFRPNQILAVGGLPLCLLDEARARKLVDSVEKRLWTPLGLRSLAPPDSRYRPHYTGGPAERDSAYHQGTVWPWLVGPFVEAWLRVRGFSPPATLEARARFVSPMLDHLEEAGLNHVSEIADAELPHTPRGAPFQAWSLGELLRLSRVVLNVREQTAKTDHDPFRFARTKSAVESTERSQRMVQNEDGFPAGAAPKMKGKTAP